MRSKEELKALLDEVRGWFLEEMGIPYDHDWVWLELFSMREERMKAFVFKRLGHLPNADLINFMDIIREEQKPKEITTVPIYPGFDPRNVSIDKKPEKKKRGRPSKH